MTDIVERACDAYDADPWDSAAMRRALLAAFDPEDSALVEQVTAMRAEARRQWEIANPYDLWFDVHETQATLSALRSPFSYL